MIALLKKLKRLPLNPPPSLKPAFYLLLGSAIGYGGYALYDKSSWVSSPYPEARLNVCFTPPIGCTTLVVKAIQGARRSIWMHAYSLTCPEITQALIQSYNRGVDVRLLVDKSQLKDKHTKIKVLAQAKVPVYIDKVSGIAHNKVIIIDELKVLTGSFNWSQAANRRNAENLLLIQDPKLAQIYKDNWIKRYQTAVPLLLP